MFPTIDKRRTGIQLRKMMDERGLTVKDIQKYLCLGSVQSVYHWLNGISLPTIDNLYALSELFQIPVDEMLCGNVLLEGSRLADVPDGVYILNCAPLNLTETDGAPCRAILIDSNETAMRLDH